MFRSKLHKRVPTIIHGASRTMQSFKQECDINNILKNYTKTGFLPHINKNQPNYFDVPSNIDYQIALNTIMDAEQRFAALPASVRDQYKNDPGQLIAALQDPAQHDKLRELGVLAPKPVASQHPTAAGTPAAPSQVPSPSAAAPGAGGGTGQG